MTRYRVIAAGKEAGHAVKLACDLLEVSRSAYYQWQQHSQAPSTREQEDTRLSKQIVAIHRENRGAYGVPRVHHQLRQDGERCSRKRVARLMSQLKLVGRAPRRFKRTTQSDPRAAAEDLVGRRFAPELYEPNQVWVGDISYVRTWEGWLYLATVIDLGSRRVIGLAMADHMRAELVIEAMRMAITSRRPGSGVIFHSDRGSQYTSGAFRSLLAKHGIVQSMSRVGECWDNAVAESFFATLKNELVYREVWPTRAGARRGIFEYIEAFYNRRRLHSSLGYRSPVDYEAWRAAIPSAVHAA